MKLSVIMMAYNQGSFIDLAIASVLGQHFPFQWELLIGDDWSQDNTESVVRSWVDRFPENIIYIRHDRNIGLHRNYEYLVKQSRGEYLALLEADDYWLDRMKSNDQVKLMDENPDVAWCITNGIIVSENGSLIKNITFDLPYIFDLSYFINNSFIPLNNTAVIRRSMEPLPYPDFFFTVRQWDMVLYYLRSIRGNIAYLPINGLAWRRHPDATSFSSEFNGIQRYCDWITINKEISKLIPKETYKEQFNNTWAYESMAIIYWNEGSYIEFIRCTGLMIYFNKANIINRIRDFVWRIRNNGL